MPRASATQRQDLRALSGCAEIFCDCQYRSRGTCGRCLVKYGCIRCPRCRSEHELLDLILTVAVKNREAMESLVNQMQWRWWYQAAETGAATYWAGKHKVGSPQLTARCAQYLEYCWQYQMVPIFLDWREGWILAGSTRYPDVYLRIGLEPASFGCVRYQDLSRSFQRVQCLFSSTEVMVRLPFTRDELAEVAAATRCVLGIEQSTAFRDDVGYWVGTPERMIIAGPDRSRTYEVTENASALMLFLATLRTK